MTDWRQDRIASALRGQNPTVLARLPQGFAVIGDVQWLPGYSLLLTDNPGVLSRGFIAPWLPEAHQQNEVVISSAATAAGRLATGGYTVVYDGVIGPWFLPAFTAATGLDRLHYLVLLPSEQCCVRRVRTRVGHGFTDLEATRHMYHQFRHAQINPRHVLADPPAQPDTTAALIREQLTGDVFVHPQR